MIESTGLLGAEEARREALQRLKAPAGYVPRGVALRMHGGCDIWHFRYEKALGENCGLGGEHFSFTVDALSGEIVGTTWMDDRFSTHSVPSEDEALAGAQMFLCRVAPGLKERLSVLWVDRHDETIVAGGSEAAVAGTKVKMRRESEGDYAWVIVGRASDGEPEVITFERDIVWDSGKGHRATEFWLSDDYLADHIAEHHPTPSRLENVPGSYGTVAGDEDAETSVAIGAFDERGVA